MVRTRSAVQSRSVAFEGITLAEGSIAFEKVVFHHFFSIVCPAKLNKDQEKQEEIQMIVTLIFFVMIGIALIIIGRIV